MPDYNHASKSSSKYDPQCSFLLEQEQQVFSSEKAVMDFITLRGIQTRTGVDKKHLPLFVLKEMMDNALDYVEKSGSNNNTTITPTPHQQPKVTVFITLEANSLLHIRVSNSNYSGKVVFTEDNVKKIFSYTSSMSSKRNQFRITRGALGDAFKELLSIPYAIAIEALGFEKWEKPLIIRDTASRREFTIKLNVDKANRVLNQCLLLRICYYPLLIVAACIIYHRHHCIIKHRTKYAKYRLSFSCPLIRVALLNL